MRSSYVCESNCAPPLCYLPCHPKSREDASSDLGPGSASPGAVAKEKPPLVQKIEAATAAARGHEEEGFKEVPVAPKSSLKRADCVDSKNVVKGNVKWMDFVGKDLTQVKEFEPRHSDQRNNRWWSNDPCQEMRISFHTRHMYSRGMQKNLPGSTWQNRNSQMHRRCKMARLQLHVL